MMALLVIVAFATGCAGGSAGSKSCTLAPGVCFPNNDLKHSVTATAAECCSVCQAFDKCKVSACTYGVDMQKRVYTMVSPSGSHRDHTHTHRSTLAFVVCLLHTAPHTGLHRARCGRGTATLAPCATSSRGSVGPTPTSTAPPGPPTVLSHRCHLRVLLHPAHRAHRCRVNQ
jgi:hypothetical protein